MHAPSWHLRSVLSGERPIHLTFFATSRRNARCGFCFYAESDAPPRRGAGPGPADRAREERDGAPELSADEVRRLAPSLGRLLWVLFSGGEPFLRADLADLAAAFHDANRPSFLTLPTNGFLPDAVASATEEILDRCAGSVVVVKLSLDGVGAAHDALRGVPGDFARWVRTYERLARLAERRPALELGVNTVFCAENQERIGEIVEFVGELDAIRSHTLTMIRGEGASRVSLARYREAVRLLEARARRHRFRGAGLKLAQDRLQRRLVERTLAERRRIVPCHAGRLDLVLTERGELHPCEGRWDLSLGNVRDAGYDAGRLLRSERARRVLGEVARGGCHCTNECNLMMDVLFDPRLWPRLAGEWLRPAARATPPAAPAPAWRRAGTEARRRSIATPPEETA